MNDEKPELRYSCTFWSRATGYEPLQLFVMNRSGLWSAWWTMTKFIWRSRKKLSIIGTKEERPDPTRLPSGEMSTIHAE